MVEVRGERSGVIKEGLLCALAFLFIVPYLQHNLYHTTLFSAYGSVGFVLFALFAGVVAAALILLVLSHGRALPHLRSRMGALASGALGTIGTASLSAAPGDPLSSTASAIGAVGAVCYALGFAGVALRAFMVLGSFRERVGLRPALGVVALASLGGFVAFSSLVPRLVYDAVAAGGLGVSAVAQAFLGPIPDRIERPRSSLASASTAFGGGWRLFFVAFVAIVILHSLLYAADPALEFLGDAPLSLATTFILLAALSVLLLVPPSQEGHYLRVVCLVGNGIFAVLFMGLLAMSFLSFIEGDFSVAVGMVLALIRVFDVLLLVGLVSTASSRELDYARLGAVYLLLLYWLPTTFAYVVLPLIVGGRTLNASTFLGPLALAIAAVLIVVVLVYLTWLLAKLIPARDRGKETSGSAKRREICEDVAREFALTQREGDVLYYASLGYSSKATAEKLYVTPGTIQSHTKRMYVKLGVHSKQQLINLIDEWERGS